MTNHHQNMTRIKVVYDALEELADQVIFVGGATVSLYADRLADEIRPTDDVDILIELLNYRDYGILETKLFAKGFANDIASKVICRYKVKGITVDVMPTSEEILGFANQWYKDGFDSAQKVDIGEGYKISVFNPIYFLASKIEAFKGRGNDDGRWSTDFEDVVYLLNNRNAIWEEVRNADDGVKTYIIDFFKYLHSHKYLYEWISVHLGYGEEEQSEIIMGKIGASLGV